MNQNKPKKQIQKIKQSPEFITIAEKNTKIKSKFKANLKKL